ncbi:MAG TPA: helix-turn-helix transcriptional regulator [Candidatus Dormibacteraeota bacterium]|nr:helix-turn-helix transcriptional regulator [Candidatus Dormibacteraeota bacterium]
MADRCNRSPNEPLRYHRRLNAWTLEDVAERLHRLVEHSGSGELGVDAHMVGRWERGVRRPTPRYVALLCELFELPADELGLVDRVDAALTKENDVRRRRFLEYLAVVSGATMLDWDRVSTLMRGAGGPADAPMLNDLRALTNSYMRQAETLAPRVLLPALRSHLAILTGALQASQPPDARRRLQSMGAETAATAGRLSHLLENRGDASSLCSLARQLAAEAGDESTLALSLTLSRLQHTPIPYGSYGGDNRRALALLDEAASHVKTGSRPQVKIYVLASRAEDRAVSGDDVGAHSDLDEAETVLARTGFSDSGYFPRWDAGRLSGYRGSCALALGRYEEASKVLESAVVNVAPPTAPQRCAMLTDLAAAYAEQHEVEQACDLLGQSLRMSSENGLAMLIQRISGARRRLTPWQDARAVRRLDEQLMLLA